MLTKNHSQIIENHVFLLKVMFSPKKKRQGYTKPKTELGIHQNPNFQQDQSKINKNLSTIICFPWNRVCKWYGGSASRHLCFDLAFLFYTWKLHILRNYLSIFRNKNTHHRLSRKVRGRADSGFRNRGSFLWLTGCWFLNFCWCSMNFNEHGGFGASPARSSVWCSPARGFLFSSEKT